MIDIAAIAAIASAFICALTYFANKRDKRFAEITKKIDEVKTSMDQGFKEVREEFKEVREEFKLVHLELSEIKQRLTFVETAMCFVDIIPDANARSEAARKAWAKRRTKQITKKGES